MNATGEAKLKFNGKEYSTYLGEPSAKEQVSEVGKSYSVGSIHIPAPELASSTGITPVIKVTGNFWHFKSDGSGATPLVFPLVPIPKSYTNIVLSKPTEYHNRFK